MEGGPEVPKLITITREAQDALARCDVASLECIARACEELVDDTETTLLNQSIASRGAGSAELLTFVRQIAHSRYTRMILRRFWKIRDEQLEYLPLAGTWSEEP